MDSGWLWCVNVGSFLVKEKKCATLVSDVDNRGGYAYVGTEDIWKISIPYAQFCCESRMTLKKIVY